MDNNSIIEEDVLLTTYPLELILINRNNNSSTISYTITKDGVAFDDGIYSTPIYIIIPGTYLLSMYVIDSSDSTKNSENIYRKINVFQKAQSPTLSHTTLTLDGVTHSYVDISFTSPDDIPVYFTLNGEDPDITKGNYFISHSSSETFKIYNNTTIIYQAYGGNYIKSDIVTTPISISKTNTLSAPTINSSNIGTLTDRFQLDITTSDGDIYYTLDGTTPTNESIKFASGQYIYPNENSNSIIIKAIASKNGYNNSIITEKTFIFNFECAPWDVVGEVTINDNSILLNENSIITRKIKMNPDYVLDFNIISATGNGILEISMDSIIGDNNNYSGIYSKSLNPIISTIYSNNNYTIYTLGHRVNRYDTNNYKKYGEIIVSSSDILSVKYYLIYSSEIGDVTLYDNNKSSTLISLTNKFYCKVKLSNLNTSIVSDWMPIDITSIDYQRIATNSLYGNQSSSFILGNLTFSCI